MLSKKQNTLGMMLDNGRDTTAFHEKPLHQRIALIYSPILTVHWQHSEYHYPGILTATEAYRLSLCTRTCLKQQAVLEGTIVLGKDSIFLAPE